MLQKPRLSVFDDRARKKPSWGSWRWRACREEEWWRGGAGEKIKQKRMSISLFLPNRYSLKLKDFFFAFMHEPLTPRSQMKLCHKNVLALVQVPFFFFFSILHCVYCVSGPTPVPIRDRLEGGMRKQSWFRPCFSNLLLKTPPRALCASAAWVCPFLVCCHFFLLTFLWRWDTILSLYIYPVFLWDFRRPQHWFQGFIQLQFSLQLLERI